MKIIQESTETNRISQLIRERPLTPAGIELLLLRFGPVGRRLPTSSCSSGGGGGAVHRNQLHRDIARVRVLPRSIQPETPPHEKLQPNQKREPIRPEPRSFASLRIGQPSSQALTARSFGRRRRRRGKGAPHRTGAGGTRGHERIRGPYGPEFARPNTAHTS